MHRFARLFEQLSLDTATSAQTALISRYLRDRPDADAAWAVALLAGATPGLRLPSRALRSSACQASGLPAWLFDACLAASGDLADTLAQVVPAPATPNDEPLSAWLEGRLIPLHGQPPAALLQAATHWWTLLAPPARYLLAKLLSAGWRSPAAPQALQDALAQHTGLAPRTVAQRMSAFMAAPHSDRLTAYHALTAAEDPQAPRRGATYPFNNPVVAVAPDEAPPVTTIDWRVFWHYDGLPAQLVKRGGQASLWLAGDRLVSDHLPEVIAASRGLPDNTVLEGQLLIWPPGADRPEDAQGLAARLKQKPAGRAGAAQHPARLMVQDILEHQGNDVRAHAFDHRREVLTSLAWDAGSALALTPQLPATDNSALSALHRTSRQHRAAGLLLRHRDERLQGVDTAPNPPLVWPAAPLRLLAVLVYAQTHGGMRSGYAHYSFAIWHRAPLHADEVAEALQALASGTTTAPDALRLVTVAKVAAEDAGTLQSELAHYVQSALTVRQGPVHTVRPGHLCELHFESLSLSARRQCGFHLRAVRVQPARSDKALQDVDNLAVLRAMLDGRVP